MIYLASVFLSFLLCQSTDWNLDRKGLVANGYDVVAYFDGSAVKGDEQYQIKEGPGIFYFSSLANLEKFKSSPEKYYPQYGGWCAYAMAESGDLVKINPETYTVTGGKLYLFYDFGKTNTLIPWQQQEVDMIVRANKNWEARDLKK